MKSSITSFKSWLMDWERVRSVRDYLWFELILQVPFCVLTSLIV